MPEDWAVSMKEQNALVNMAYYKSHAEIVPTQREVPLDSDSSKLHLSLTGNCQIPTMNLGIFENQLRDLLRVLSHSDIFSYAAYKCLQQESMDTKVLARILESLAHTINHWVSLASCLTLEMQQARRDPICSAPKSLSEIAKMKLRSTPFISDSLFGGQRDEIYKETTEALKNDLISKTVTFPHGIPQVSTPKGVKPEFKKPSLRPQNPRIQDKKPQSSYSKKTQLILGRGIAGFPHFLRPWR